MTAKEKQDVYKRQDKIFGDDNPAFSLEIPDGVLVGDDTAADLAVTISCSADNMTAAGSSVAVTGTSNSENYDVTVTNGTLTVKKRVVDVKAKDVDVYKRQVPPTVVGASQFRITSYMRTRLPRFCRTG